jgi:predicted restriction endonuclease
MGEPIPKYQKPNTCLDMSGLTFQKVNRKQRVDKKARKVTDRCKCQIPGCHREAQKAYHHAIQKSVIVIDHILNFLRLCDVHHLECDEGIISQVDQFEIIAHKNNMTVEEVLKTLEEFAGVNLFIDKDSVKVEKPIFNRRTG